MNPTAYKVTAHVLLHEPVPSDDGKVMIAYFRLYFVTATDLHAAVNAIALDVAEDGVLDRSDLQIAPTEIAKLDAVFLRSYPGPEAEGIWYRSGRGFHW